MLVRSVTDVLPGSPTLGQTRNWTYGYSTLGSGLKVLTSLDGPGDPGQGVNDVTTYKYNPDGTLERMIDANGFVTVYENYTAFGQPGRIRTPEKIVYDLDYDAEGRLIASSRVINNRNRKKTTFEYDAVGQLISTTDTRRNTWQFVYDEARRLTKTINPLGEVMDLTYDALGNVTGTTYQDASGAQTFFQTSEFDELGRLMRLIDHEGQVLAKQRYDVEDNLTDISDALNYEAQNVFDALNRVVARTDEGGYATFTAHNDLDLPTSFTDPRNLETTFTYNGFGEVVQEISPDRGTRHFTYDSRGFVIAATDGRGVEKRYAYDDGGRLTEISYPSAAAETQTFTYADVAPQWRRFRPSRNASSNGSNHWNGPRIVPASRLTVADDETGQTEIYYAANGSVRQEVFTFEVGSGGLSGAPSELSARSPSYTHRYTFDDEGNLRSLTYGSGRVVKYSYDAADQVTKVTTQMPRRFKRRTIPGPVSTIVSDITHLPWGGIGSMLYLGTQPYTATYDQSYSLIRETDETQFGLQRDVSYGYNARDELISVTDALGAPTESYSYTPRGALARADGAWGTLDWQYDGVRNRTTQTFAALDASASTDAYSYDTISNRLISIAQDGAETRRFYHDAAGNVTYDDRSGTVYEYSYNAAGRLAALTINGVRKAEYIYNARGQQAVRRLPQEQREIRSFFDPFGNRIAEIEFNLLNGSSKLLREYVWLEGMPVAVIEDGEIYAVRTDHIGRPLFATDEAGTKIWEVSYRPFGGVELSSGDALDLRFPGQWFQLESGLHQNWMRDYDPTTGRYLQADPLGLVDGASVYGYALQSPLMHTDPRGERILRLLQLVGIGSAGVEVHRSLQDDGCLSAGEAFGIAGSFGFIGRPSVTMTMRGGALRAANRPSVGGANFMGDADQFFRNARNRPDIDPNGYFDVIAHGTSSRIQIRTPNGTRLVNHRTAARLIQQQPGYNGQGIRLLSCSTGRCGSSFAQNLSNRLGVTVRAPSDLLWAYPNGRMVVAPRGANGLPDISRQGGFRTFTPGGNVAN